MNRVLASGGQVFWIEGTLDAEGMSLGPGAFYIPARAVARSQVEEWANELGVTFYGVAAASAGAMFELTNARVGLWDRYGGSMPSGWTRYILEDFEFNFEVIYPPEIDEGSA